MSLKIELEHGPQHIHFPGQHVRGVLKYILWKQKNIHTASIVFRGKVETEYVEARRGQAGNTHGPRKRAQEIHRLFEYNQQLFTGPFDVPPQTLSWPFDFTIPTHVESRRVNNISAGFIPDGFSQIPPTFAFSDSTFSHNAYAKVRYKLVARVTTGGLSGSDDLEIPITISRLAPDPPPAPRLFINNIWPSISWASRALRQEDHSLKQKLKHAFSDDPQYRTPCIGFKANVHFPKSISPSQKFRIGFSIVHIQITPNDPPNPELLLVSMRISSRTRTEVVVAPGGLSVFGDRHAASMNYETDKFVKLEPMHLPLDGSAVTLEQQQCLANWKAEGMLAWQPDFSTYTIKFSHSIKVYVTILHPQTRHQFEMKTEFPLEVLEPHASELAGVYGAVIGPSYQRQAMEVDETDLPRYEDDVRPPEVELSAYAGNTVAETGTTVPVGDAPVYVETSRSMNRS